MLTLNKCLLTELQGTKSFCKSAMSNVTLQFKRWSVPYQSRDWQLYCIFHRSRRQILRVSDKNFDNKNSNIYKNSVNLKFYSS